ncbi:Acyl-CoA thioesterase II [Rhodococcus wratislaviensis]|uniref:Acyl-CoA thioesterase II n=1 Tax=Rhodococcus wratislaviensis TaxID=44752 RepID=A0A402CKU2_RHOWR|nr:acyl-CoA thioesterase domain-containing protein [Rhodococcus wratislaviensis]GCE44242.1 Acyl-CoA thioesterase II [Rhodococcus wratislaviensis]
MSTETTPVATESRALTSAIFTDAATLKPAAPELFDVAFTAVTQPCPWPKAYGGDMVTQAAVAAMRSVENKAMHSMHSYFMRPVDIGAEIRYEVEVLRDGRGYSQRQVRGVQNGKVAYVAMASFASGAPGGTFHSSMPADIPDPEPLPSTADYLSRRNGGTMTAASKAYWCEGRSFDMRHVPGPVYLTVEGGPRPQQAVWVKPFDTLRSVAGLTTAQRDLAALAYVCDYTILEPLLRLLGLSWADEGVVTASLDHTMWIHRSPQPGDLDGWLLYAQEAVATDSGRGLGYGRFFTPDHRHLATVVQEGMIREPERNPS